MRPIHRQLVALILASTSGLANLRADALSWQTMNLRGGIDISLPRPPESSLILDEKAVGVRTTFIEIIPLALRDGHVVYLKIATDPPPNFRRDMLFLAGSEWLTSTRREIEIVRYLARKNRPASTPPWNEYWASIRRVGVYR